MPSKVLKICRAVYKVDTSRGSTSRYAAEHFCADAVLCTHFDTVFPAKMKGAPIAAYDKLGRWHASSALSRGSTRGTATR